MEMGKTLMNENEDVITTFGFLNIDESNYTKVLICFVSFIFRIIFSFQV
jgi:hypothetical protein